ncbi:MAG: hypothetical protein JSS87_00400 [Acidobacteria bacterium]|nr:hypothetical protein [Acidobacteriota bacterium]
MATYIVDPLKFHAEGVMVDWLVVARRLLLQKNLDQRYTVQLRWMLKAEMGMPTEPFQVWRRARTTKTAKALHIAHTQLLFPPLSLVTWIEGTMSSVSVQVNAPSGGTIAAYSGSPTINNICTLAAVPAGATGVSLSAHAIEGLMLSPGVQVTGVTGIEIGDYANYDGWQLIEIVGLPVDKLQWSSIGKYGGPQGLVGALVAAPDAAVQRLKRGAPPFGWGPNIATGVPAPAWSAPDPMLLVKETNASLLDELRPVMANFPPAQQAAQIVEVPLPPPENSSGQKMSGSGSTTQASPLGMSLMAASTDPFLNLTLGFGTAYPYTPNPLVLAGPPVFDYMVTARWEKGIDGNSADIQYAAVIPAPGAAFPPITPANVNADDLGVLRPAVPDGDWRASVRVSWDRPIESPLFRNVSVSFARAGITPASGAELLMQKRASGGFSPIVINNNPGDPTDPDNPPDPDFAHIHLVDREMSVFHDPGSRSVKYGVAMQDIYGVWTPWVPVDHTVTQPALDVVRIISAELQPVVPASGSVCPASLQIEFAWDWEVRTPANVTFVGTLYPAATRGTPPPSEVVPAGLGRSLGAIGTKLVVTFSGDVPSAPGCTIVPLSSSGDQQLPGFGPAQGAQRRYRLTLSGLSLDFASTPFIGLSLWSQGQEAIAPHRVSPWGVKPQVISIGDPRPPIIAVVPVTLGSVPDASGQSHARIAWAPQPNADGFFVYEASETAILEATGKPQPAQNATLQERGDVLRAAFKANPVRRPFTRLNSTLLRGVTSTDIALPRGSREIHLYVVLGVSAGQVESPWPSGPNADDALYVIAAPHIDHPLAPTISIQRVFDGGMYKAKLQIETRLGPRPRQIDLHRVRVDDAAKELDTMGPPVARVRTSGGGWNVSSVVDPVYGNYIGAIDGVDAPAGSWKRVWYRAVAWSDHDPTRGGLPGRSDASNAAWVVLPPATGPVITPLVVIPGAPAGSFILEWKCASPLKKTPLGSHLIAVRASTAGAASSTPPLLRIDSTLDALPHAQPAADSGIWIAGTAAGVTTYRAFVKRTNANDVVTFAVSITDPLGRSGEQFMTVDPIAPDAPADLQHVKATRQIFTIPQRTVLTFTSTSPLAPQPDGVYTLHVAGQLATLIPHVLPPSITVALGKIPTKGPITPPLPTIWAVRSGAGPNYTYSVVTTAKVKGFTVRITAPDGTFAEKTVAVA